MSAPSGHLFVIDGDLTRLFCDAILIPVDRDLNVTGAWIALLGNAGFTNLDDVSPPVGWGTTVRAFQLTERKNGPAIWLGEIGRSMPSDDWYAAGLVEFIERAVRTLNQSGVVPPRVAVNVAGAGEGGGARDKGRLFTTIVPALLDVVERLHVDVVLVCWGDKPYAAAQRARQRALAMQAGSPAGLTGPLGDAAKRLASHARAANLVLFLGAGVSMGAGLQSWQALISELARKAERPIQGVERLGELDVRDQDLWGDDLEIIPMMRPPSGARPSVDDVAVAARSLDILLDQIALLATDVSTFLLDSTYESMLDEEERQLASDLRSAAKHARAGTGPVAMRLNHLFSQLGGQ